MAASYKKLSFNQLTSSQVTQYTAPASTQTSVTGILLHNTDGSARTVTINQAAAGSDSLANRIVRMTINSGDTVFLSPVLTLNAGDAICAMCDVAGKVNMVLSGTEFT